MCRFWMEDLVKGNTYDGGSLLLGLCPASRSHGIKGVVAVPPPRRPTVSAPARKPMSRRSGGKGERKKKTMEAPPPSEHDIGIDVSTRQDSSPFSNLAEPVTPDL